MTNIIDFTARKPRHGSLHPVDLEAAARVATTIELTRGPIETETQFVTRIVRAYKAEGGV